MAVLLPENDAGGIWARLVFNEVFKRLHTPLEIITMPESRSYSEVMAGHVAGELARADQYAQIHPDLLRFKIPSATIRILAYSTVPIKDWNDLRTKNVRIDYKIGNAVAQTALKGLEPNDRISTLREDLQGFKKLASGRTEVYIGYDASTYVILKTHPALARKVKYQKVLNTFETYTYLHPKYKDLALQMERTLKQLDKEGKIEKARLVSIEKAEASSW